VVSRGDPGCDAVGIRIGGLPDVHAAAHRCVASDRHRAAARGRLTASALLIDTAARVCWIEDAELRSIDPDLRALHNVHAPEDL
jgi:hypothetical protein